MDALLAEELAPESNGKQKGFDPEEARQMLGLTDLQYKFAMAKLRGCNHTQAARAAGYSGDDDALRGAGSKAMKSDAVRNFLKWAEVEGAGIPDEIVAGDDLKRILSRHANSADKNHSIRACEVLHRINQAEKEAETEAPGLEELCERLLEYRYSAPLLALLWVNADKTNKNILAMPHKEKVLPVLKREWPDVWRALRGDIATKRPDKLEHIENLANQSGAAA